MNICKKCETKFDGNFCPNCSFPVKLKTIDGQYVFDEVRSVFNLEKGVLFTIKNLLLRPGPIVREFINQDRTKLVKPILFLIICSLVYTISQQFLDFKSEFVAFKEESIFENLIDWLSTNYGYSNIILAIPIAFWTKILFRKQNYNYYQIFTILSYYIGISVLIQSIFGIINGVTSIKVVQIGFFIGSIYVAWAIGQFFERQNRWNYLKGFLSYLLGVITFIGLIILIGLITIKFS